GAQPLGFCRQVGEELRQLRPVLRVQRGVHPDQERILAQPALGEPVSELTDRVVAVGIRGAHPVIVVREPVTERLHTRKYRVARVGTQVSPIGADARIAASASSYPGADGPVLVNEAAMGRGSVASCSGKWHAATWPGPNGRSSGSSAEQTSCASGHLVRNRQPDGGRIGLGNSPAMPALRRTRPTPGSGTGIVAINPAVYGCAARW